jgi:hypothetical protein
MIANHGSARTIRVDSVDIGVLRFEPVSDLFEDIRYLGVRDFRRR